MTRDEYVKCIVAQWPKITDQQLDKIAALLRAGSRTTKQATSSRRSA